ncbi:MAG: hypothetical protein KC432_11720 [Thermomicrobiales bacterium]|nr:hypothetical protein [Thermomicrobiales bacterium]
MLVLEFSCLLPGKRLRDAVLLIVVRAIAKLPLASLSPPMVVVPMAILPVAFARLRFDFSQRDAEKPGCSANHRDLDGLTARRCLRQRSGEEIEPSFIHVRHSSWRLEPLPLIIAGTLLAYAISTTRKRETGTSGFMFQRCGRSECGDFPPER